MITVLEHGAEVARDAVHTARPNRLDPGLFDRLEHGACRTAFGKHALVNRRIVASKA